MGTTNINVYGRDYAIACDDGEEEHVNQLASMVNKRVQELLQQLGRAPEHTMLIYASLMLADELLDVTRGYKKLKTSYQQLSKEQAPADDSRVLEMEAAMAASMQQIAGRVEKLADQLEKAA